MIHRFARTLKGFTLVEMMMSSILAIIIIIFLTNFFLNALISKQIANARQDLNYNMDFALHLIEYQLKKATSVDTISSTFGAHPGSLVFSNASPSESPLTISTSGSDLTFERGVSESYSLLTNQNQITDLTFDYVTPNNSTGIISGSITMESLIDDNISSTQTFSLTLRTNL